MSRNNICFTIIDNVYSFFADCLNNGSVGFCREMQLKPIRNYFEFELNAIFVQISNTLAQKSLGGDPIKTKKIGLLVWDEYEKVTAVIRSC